MALESWASEIALDICVILSMVVFTGVRLAVQHNAQKRQYRGPSRSELVAAISLILCACAAISQSATTIVDNSRFHQAGNDVDAQNAYEWRSSTLRIDFVEVLMSAIAIWLLKAAYLATFFGMAVALPRTWLRALYAVSMYTGVAAFTSIMLHIFWCKLPQNNWDVQIIDGTPEVSCSMALSWELNSIHTALDIVADLLILCLGAGIVRSLRIESSLALRLALTMIFVIGISSIAAAATRCALLIWMFDGPASRQTAENSFLMIIFLKLEVIVGTAAYGMAFTRSLLRDLFKRVGETPLISKLLNSTHSHGSIRESAVGAKTAEIGNDVCIGILPA